jgi:hypothetical protein
MLDGVAARAQLVVAVFGAAQTENLSAQRQLSIAREMLLILDRPD